MIEAMRRVRHFFRRRDTTPEDSVPLRVITFLAQSVAAFSLAYVAAMPWLWVLGTLLLAGGHWYAYRFRHNPQRWMRRLVVVALHVGLFAMLVGVIRGMPYPQAIFAVTMMGLVSVEVFSRLNLYSALGLGMVNIYAAASLSRDLWYGVFVLLFIGLMLAFFWRADSEDGLKRNRHVLRHAEPARNRERRSRLSWALRFALVGIPLAALVFVLTPHYAGRPLFPPISLTVPVESSPRREVLNPAVPLVQIEGLPADPEATSEYFFGFGSSVDLSYRGGLSDTILMYVSSPAWSYWRGYAYDVYDGQAWYQSDTDIEEVTTEEGVRFYLQEGEEVEGDIFVHTFYIVQPMPNVLWVGGDPVEVYFPAESLGIDATGGIRIGEPLAPGLIYSVVSERVDFEPEELRANEGPYPPAVLEQHLQLPESVTQRTRDLARQLAEGQPTRYDTVIAIRDYLLQTYPYDYFPPPQAPNQDSVDQFLFEFERGFCEMYVSSMVVMLRELGIPSRFVVGYGSGLYNPFTGFYEVQANHAHSWVEVYFPESGWVPFDPTPGWEGSPETGIVQTWVFSELLAGVELPRISFGAAAEAGLALLSAASAPLLLAAGLAGALGLTLALWRVWRWWQRRRRRRIHRDPVRRQIFRAYRRMQRRSRQPRQPGQTAQEHAAQFPEFQELADAVDIAAYRPAPPDAGLLARVRALLRRPRRKR